MTAAAIIAETSDYVVLAEFNSDADQLHGSLDTMLIRPFLLLGKQNRIPSRHILMVKYAAAVSLSSPYRLNLSTTYEKA